MVETVGICQVVWFVMLEPAKDQVIGVDTPGQQVPPHVCASRPSRYVLVINDNHLVSLMNFNAAKVD
jgi:hypothetical protein